ncbi:hypothetical protein C8F01DRAFT_752234 [Mycena amicta]|nr:hypothetical protein C8F01DRAFT_752234 [Mycena amicta]
MIALPLELERATFEMAAALNPTCMPSLILVAHRVKIWIEPILYHALIVESESTTHLSRVVTEIPKLSSFTALSHARKDFLQQHVRSLCFIEPGNPQTIPELLHLCSNITTLFIRSFSPHAIRALFIAPSLADRPAAPGLQRLTIDVSAIFIDGQIDFSPSYFATITHLDLHDISNAGMVSWAMELDSDWDTSSNNTIPSLAALPNLTHLAFHDGKIPLHSCFDILKRCTRLVVLVLLETRGDERRLRELVYVPLASDSKFVMMTGVDLSLQLKEWQAHERGRPDFWVAAEELALSRRREGGWPGVLKYNPIGGWVNSSGV